MNECNEIIKRLRINKCYTQNQLAAKLQLRGCDITRYDIIRIEKGIYKLDIKQMIIIITILSCNPKDDLKRILDNCYNEVVNE